MLFKNTNITADSMTHSYLPAKKFIIKNGVENSAAIAKGGLFSPVLSPRSVCRLTDGAVLLVDFGEEISGGIKLVFHQNDGNKIRICFGESAAEALSNIGDFGSCNDHSVRDTVLSVASLGSAEYGRTGFRFVCLSTVNGALGLVGLFARADFADIKWRGSFESSDKKLNEIWRICARTLHLNMQDMLLDGIKRDRLSWMGDMHPEVRCALALFGDTDCVRRTLDFVRDTTPKGAWMNGIPSYSLWWIVIQYDLYMYSGDKDYLGENIPCMLDILSRFAKSMSNGGVFIGLDNFLDWSMYDDNSARNAAFCALAALAFEKGAYLCRAIGTQELCAAAEMLDSYARKTRSQRLWTLNKQAIAMQVLAGQKSCDEVRDGLVKDTEHALSVFYGYYLICALSECGMTAHALAAVKKYWGAMLDLGATTFFENFALSETEGELPPLKIDMPPTEGFQNIYAHGGAHCYYGYRRSLAHGWASGPLAWIAEYLLGIKILEPGCKRISVTPRLAGLRWFKGKFPTPLGDIEISVTKTDGAPTVEISAPDGIEITVAECAEQK